MALKPCTYPLPETRFLHAGRLVYKFKIRYVFSGLESVVTICPCCLHCYPSFHRFLLTSCFLGSHPLSGSSGRDAHLFSILHHFFEMKSLARLGSYQTDIIEPQSIRLTRRSQ
uniref:Uncharacterized protein n=1 Tax=Otus sunia TaxID=257818 RepID=A0A8C8B8B5_9STRI